MKNWENVVRLIVKNIAFQADDYISFYHQIKEYELTNEDLRDLGWSCALEINYGNIKAVYLFASKDDAIEKLQTTLKVFNTSHNVVDTYIRDDDMYAHSYTDRDDLCYSAKIIMLE